MGLAECSEFFPFSDVRGTNNSALSAPETQSPISDIDAADRPVREQLKETSIKSSSDSVQETASNRKRSLEECREETLDSEKPRKRSRNSTPETPTVSDQNSIEPISAPQTNGNPIIVDLTISESEEETSESSYETAGSEEETSESSYETAMSEEESSESETENEEDLIAFQAKHMPIITKSNAKIWQYQWERKYGRKFTNSFKQDSDAPNKQDPDASNKQDPDASKNDTTPNTKDPELVANSKEVKKKRSHEHLETDLESPATTSATTKDPAGTDTTDIKSATDGEREKKRHRDNSQEPKPVADNVRAPTSPS